MIMISTEPNESLLSYLVELWVWKTVLVKHVGGVVWTQQPASHTFLIGQFLSKLNLYTLKLWFFTPSVLWFVLINSVPQAHAVLVWMGMCLFVLMGGCFFFPWWMKCRILAPTQFAGHTHLTVPPPGLLWAQLLFQILDEGVFGALDVIICGARGRRPRSYRLLQDGFGKTGG